MLAIIHLYGIAGPVVHVDNIDSHLDAPWRMSAGHLPSVPNGVIATIDFPRFSSSKRGRKRRVEWEANNGNGLAQSILESTVRSDQKQIKIPVTTPARDRGFPRLLLAVRCPNPALSCFHRSRHKASSSHRSRTEVALQVPFMYLRLCTRPPSTC